MAIYKPSNCAPFLGAVDLTLLVQNGVQEDINVSFEVNCSNVTPVSAYKIKVLNNNNDVIFEGDEFTLVDPSWLSGTEQQVPLVTLRTLPSSASDANKNVIYYDGTTYKVSKKQTDGSWTYETITDFVNGGTNQPYKWIITLAQGVTSANGTIKLPSAEEDKENKWWDIPVTQGQILGSTPKRIQGKYSEYIYKDYFIQLIFINEAGGEELIKPRARISSYDYSFGYIYPQEGQLTQEMVNGATNFKIYRNTSDPQYIQTDRAVDFIYQVGDISSIKINGASASSFYWDGNSAGKYTIEYSEELKEEDVLAAYRDQNVFGGNFEKESSSVLFTNNAATQTVEPTDPKFSVSSKNGVFHLVGVSGKVVTWQRTSNFKNWSSYLNRDIFVRSEGANFSNNAGEYGVIGETALQFSNEKAIEIYPEEETDQAKTLGTVYKNSEGKTYIRPSNNIKSDMRFSYVDNTGELQHTLIKSYDDEEYCIIHDEKVGPLAPYSDTDGNKNTYTIESFFKISDENPFYAYAIPKITIKVGDTEITEAPGENMATISTRYVTFVAEFDQTDNKSWKNFQYELMDITTGNSQTGEKKYSGEIEDTFYGLQDGHTYGVTLVVEDEFSNVLVREGYFNVKVELVESEYPFTATYDCLTHSVILDFIKDGIIVPYPDLNDQSLNVYGEIPFVVIQTKADGTPNIIWKSGDTPPKVENCIGYYYRYINGNNVFSGRFNDKSVQQDVNKVTDNNGIIYVGELFYVKNEFYSEGSFPWVPVYQLVKGNQYKMILGSVTDPTAVEEQYKALMQYKQLKDGGSLPASETGTITFRSVHQIGNEFFEGSIVEYTIDTENYNNVPSRFKIDIIVPSVTSDGEDGMISNIYDGTNKDDYANKDRNGIYVRVVREIKDSQGAYSELPLTVIKKWFTFYEYAGGWNLTKYNENETGRYWQKANDVVSVWINGEWSISDNADYIDTKYFYKEGTVSGNLNIRGEGLWTAGAEGTETTTVADKNVKILVPFQSSSDNTGTNETVWYDITTDVGLQANKSTINVFNNSDLIWQDKKDGNDCYWQDKPVGAPQLYQQTNINNNENHTGRQNITKKKFLFNLVIKNYDDKNKQLTTINDDSITAQCYVVGEE